VNTGNPRTKHLFVVDIWREASAQEAAPWRGVVKHAGHECQSYFHTLDGLTEFISARLAAEPAAASEPESPQAL